MLILALWSALVGAASVETLTYKRCESVGFRWKICEPENKLCKLGPNPSSCKYLKADGPRSDD